MSDDDIERSGSGSPIFRHEKPERDFEFAAPSEDIEVIERHISEHLGPVDMVFHEVISNLVHIDVHQIYATEERPFHWLVTTGMSDLPMSTPEGAEDCCFAEVMIALPADWPLSTEAFKDERNYWPIRLLKFLARFPHEYQTWLWWSHTIPNGDPPKPFADNCGFAGVMLAPPILVPEGFATCPVSDTKEVSFFAAIPLYPEEMQLKLDQGADALYDLFDKQRVSELLNIRRKNVARKAWWRLF